VLIETLKVPTGGECDDGVPVTPANTRDYSSIESLRRSCVADIAFIWASTSIGEALWSRSSQTAACSPQCLPALRIDLRQKINLTTRDRIERKQTRHA
jgi:hypothetical protein